MIDSIKKLKTGIGKGFQDLQGRRVPEQRHPNAPMMTTIRTRNPRRLKKRPRMRFFPPTKKSKAPMRTKDPATRK